jgi:hypothetical protein
LLEYAALQAGLANSTHLRPSAATTRLVASIAAQYHRFCRTTPMKTSYNLCTYLYLIHPAELQL